jgi:hypothetical protein
MVPPPVPPAPPAPTSTPTLTPTITSTPVQLPGTPTPSANCIVPPALVVLTGQGDVLGDCFPIYYIGTPSPTPTPTWAGTIPPHPWGRFVIQTLGDWTAYLATSYFPGASMPPPFNPATQRLAMDAFSISMPGCGSSENIIQVCDDGTSIHVVIQITPMCCGNPPAYHCSSGVVQAVVVPKNGEPVVWDIVYIVCPPNIVQVPAKKRFLSAWDRKPRVLIPG